MTDINHLNKNLFIRIKPPNTSKPSFIWNHFGHLYKKPNELLDGDRIYCKLCLDQFKNEQPDAFFPSIKKYVGVYSGNSGTGNLKNHLMSIHRITEPQQIKTTNQHCNVIFNWS